ncbi:MAG TPA: helix-turn-helix transcriptional regulator [Sphingobium sp.]
MITRIRDMRKAQGLTLEQVAERCDPPTTAQTIGRLETGTRTVSVNWLNRIAAALEVTAADLVDMPGQESLPVAALLGQDGARAPTQPLMMAPPLPAPEMVGVRLTSTLGEYRTGDELWCDKLAPGAYASALNRDVLVPRPGGRFLFGRLIGRDGDKLQLLPLESGSRQQVVNDPPWAAVVSRLVRRLL